MLQSKPQEEPAPAEVQPRADMAFVLSAPEAPLASTNGLGLNT